VTTDEEQVPPETLNTDEVTRLSGCKDFVSMQHDLVFSAFCYFEPVKRL